MRRLWLVLLCAALVFAPSSVAAEKAVTRVNEQGCSWIPTTLAMLDGFYHQMKAGRVGELNAVDGLLPHAPSESFASRRFR